MSEGSVLLIKNKKNKMTATVRKRMNRGYAPDDYMKVLNPNDANDLALFFEDLELLLNAPIDKAFRKYKDKKSGTPFF